MGCNNKLSEELLNVINDLRQGQKVKNQYFNECDYNSEEERKLCEEIKKFIDEYNQNYNYIIELSQGKLEVEPPRKNSFANPYKQLHSELLHLTWQIQQISNGDYNQKVSFSGDFSDAINRMIESLKEKERADELNLKYLNELKELNAMKDKFFSIISHDLKNPFSSLLGFSELLVNDLKEKNYENVEDYANIIKDITEQGYKLLINLLEWSRSQSKSIKIEMKEVDVDSIIRESIDFLGAMALQKNIEIHYFNKSDQLPIADENMLKTIVRNIMSNAIKFTSRGGRIIVDTLHKENKFIIKIKDSGVGISAERIEKMFKIDSSVSTKGTENEAGTGLGLILCKDFVEKMKGSIVVESEVGNGSIFSIILNLNK